jgi:hypothetical protein
MSVFNRRNAFIGWLVITLAKPVAKQKAARPRARPAQEGRRGRCLDRSRGAAAAGSCSGASAARTARPPTAEPRHRRRRRGSRRLRGGDVPRARGRARHVVDWRGSVPAPPGETAASSSASRSAGSTTSSPSRSRSTRSSPTRARPFDLEAVADARPRRRGGRARGRARYADAVGGRRSTSGRSLVRGRPRRRLRGRRRAHPRRHGRDDGAGRGARAGGREFRLGCEAKRILVSRGRVTGLATDEGVLPASASSSPPALAALLLRPLESTARDRVPRLAPRDRRVDPRPATPSSRRSGRRRTRWPGSSAADVREVAGGAAEEPGIVSLLLGARPDGLPDRHVASPLAPRRPRGPGDGAPAARARRPRSRRPRGCPVVAAWSGRRAHTPDGLPVVGLVPGSKASSLRAGSPPSAWSPPRRPAAARAGDTALFDPARFASH